MMAKRKLGPNGPKVGAVGMGCWAIGGHFTLDGRNDGWGQVDDAQSVRSIELALDLGASLFDTADAYGTGHSEEVLGSALKGRRDEAFIATKFGFTYDAAKKALLSTDLSSAYIDWASAQSLKRLGTDYIDHYITHWQDPTTPVTETMDALERLKAQGKIRSIGASNVSTGDVNAYLAAGSLDAVQQQYSMVNRDIENDLLPLCIDKGVSVLSYSSLALGLLSGKIGPERVFGGDDQRKDNPLFSQSNRQKVAGLMRDIRDIAHGHDATEAQIVIAWTLQQPGISFSLCGARTAQQARENARAGRLRLSAEEIGKISEAARRNLIDLDRR